MRRTALGTVLAAAALGVSMLAQELPVRGLHLSAPRPDEVEAAVRFIRDALPQEGVNTLVIEFGYRVEFERRPEIREPEALSRDQVRALAAACRAANIRLVPQINLLGHQSWRERTFALLRAYPDFDETPGKYPNNEGIYCRSYCPLHPKVHEVVFDLVDELIELCQATEFHAGMDEVFLIGEDDCPRCRGRDKAELFAGEVRRIRDHLAKSGRRLWIWGDRLLDGQTTGLGRWEASLNGTHRAVELIPKDVVICDWHYDTAAPTAAYFATLGFEVVSSPWRKAEVALAQLQLARWLRRNAPEPVAKRVLGVLQTSWVGFGQFLRAYTGEGQASAQAHQAAACFRALFAELRKSASLAR
ncbi:MAG: family 20 glycosylhydrolase [Bryobacterales bacterium]|nr:family 20 glycosylhydrolase [Bryobacteraceae bacterium]MDW8354965.1 family 20 glycosylhydrolase [Bryobacterales bacterium]